MLDLSYKSQKNQNLQLFKQNNNKSKTNTLSGFRAGTCEKNVGEAYLLRLLLTEQQEQQQ